MTQSTGTDGCSTPETEAAVPLTRAIQILHKLADALRGNRSADLMYHAIDTADLDMRVAALSARSQPNAPAKQVATDGYAQLATEFGIPREDVKRLCFAYAYSPQVGDTPFIDGCRHVLVAAGLQPINGRIQCDRTY